MPHLCNSSTSTLIIIDLQEKLMPVIANGAEVLQRTLVLAQAAKLLGVPVLGTEQQPLRLGRTIPAIELQFDQSIEKVDFDASANPHFLTMLEPGRDEFIVLGCEAHVCVLQTVLGLLKNGRRVKLVVDAIGSRKESDRHAAIERARSAGAEMVTAEMVMFEWMRNSEHPKFREILKLIK